MKHLHWFKFTAALLLGAVLLAGLIWPALADPGDISLSSFGGASPDIKVSNDGQFIAVVYFKQESHNGAVYIKSATAAGGWLTTSFLGTGTNPRLAFSASSNNVVYVVWAKSGNTAIQSAKCTLSTSTSPVCSLGADVQTSLQPNLDFPDIAVDNAGLIHVAWQNNGVIETSHSTSVNSVASWSTPVQVSGSGSDQRPVLADDHSGNPGKLHLAFLRGSSSVTPTQVQYYRSTDGSTNNPHSWGANHSFVIGTDVLTGAHDKFNSLSIAASGNKVFLTWDAHQINSNNFSLIQASSTDSGSNWPGGATYAPSGNSALGPVGSEAKNSAALGVPPQEAGLQPSLTISNSTAALVWQQFPPSGSCLAFQTSEIFLASPPTTGSSDGQEQSDTDSNFMIDPELAVYTSTQHMVFMVDPSGACPGGLATAYKVFYRGPFTIVTNDGGEGGGVFLPIIKKNN